MIPGGGHLPAYLRSPERRGLQVRHRSPAPGGHTQAPATPPPPPADALAGQKYPLPVKPCAPGATKYPGSFRPDAGARCRGKASLGPGAGAHSPRPGARSEPREAGSRAAGPSRPRKGALVSPPCSLPRSPQPGPWLSAPIANIPTDKMALHRGTSEGHGPAGQTFLRIN